MAGARYIVVMCKRNQSMFYLFFIGFHCVELEAHTTWSAVDLPAGGGGLGLGGGVEDESEMSLPSAPCEPAADSSSLSFEIQA